MSESFDVISFSSALAGQEPAVKFAALAGLHEYFRIADVGVRGQEFWSTVERFQNRTDGIHTASAEEIFRAFIPLTHKERIEGLGFKVGPA